MNGEKDCEVVEGEGCYRVRSVVLRVAGTGLWGGQAGYEVAETDASLGLTDGVVAVHRPTPCSVPLKQVNVGRGATASLYLTKHFQLIFPKLERIIVALSEAACQYFIINLLPFKSLLFPAAAAATPDT